ncbi:MAG: hypothetical protein HY909_22265 [Deltaproteobacteria bacterium]|nr:hypothetical protein [Deltaproteobacteria bacterium]
MGLQACALAVDGSVWCWGDNDGPGLHGVFLSSDFRRTPHRIQDLPPIRQVSSFGGHVCALDYQGSVWCWGRNADRECGCGDGRIQRTPCRALP